MDYNYGNLEQAFAGKKYLCSERLVRPIAFMARRFKIKFSATINQTIKITAKDAANILFRL